MNVWTVLSELRPQLMFEAFAELLKDSAQRLNNYYATMSDGACVALVGWRIHNDARIGRHAYVADLVVSKSVRGGGIGRAMVDFVAKDAAGVGCKALVLVFGVTNTGAHLFYESFGFEKTAVQFSMPLPPLSGRDPLPTGTVAPAHETFSFRTVN